jgi:hypothetical protein
MDETRRRRLAIANELVTCGVAMPALMARIATANEMPTLSGRNS